MTAGAGNWVNCTMYQVHRTEELSDVAELLYRGTLVSSIFLQRPICP